MPNKEFVTCDMIRDAAIKLAHKMHVEDGFIPDVIYDLLRGGAYLSNVISEYYSIACGHNPRYAAVVTHSYSGVNQRQKSVEIDGWTIEPSKLEKGQKILVVDDVYDTGYTICTIVEKLMEAGIPREDIKVAVYDYKIHAYKQREILPVVPDYSCRKFVYERPEDVVWVHYLTHELEGLSADEIDLMYPDPEVRAILHGLNR